MPRRHLAIVCFLAAALARSGVAEDLPTGALARLGDRADSDKTTGAPVMFAPDGLLVYFGTPRGRIDVWDVQKRSRVTSFAAQDGAVSAVWVSDDGAWVATGCADGKTAIHEAATGKQVAKFSTSQPPVRYVSISPDRAKVAIWGRGTLDFYEVETGFLQPGAWRAPADVTPIRFGGGHRDGRRPTSGFVFFWDRATGAPVWGELETPALPDWTALSPDGALYATGGNQAGFDVWETRSGAPIAQWPSQRRDLVALEFAADDSTLLSVDRHGQIAAWDAFTGKCLWEESDLQAVWVDASRDGRWLASGHRDGTVLLWDAKKVIRARAPRADAPVADLTDATWDSLAGGDAAEAWRLVLSLAAIGDDGVLWLRGKLVRPPPSEEAASKWIAALDADDFGAREEAQRELAAAGAQVEPLLRKAVAAPASEEARERIEQLLAALDPPLPLVAGEALRASRALAVIERVGTPAARDLLRDLSRTAVGVRLRRDAEAALKRIERRR